MGQESEEDRVIWESLLSPLEETGRLDLVDGRTSMDDGITLLPAPGHTPGHQVVEIRSGTDRLLLSGDAVNHPFQLAYPDWASASDSDPHVAALTRAAMTQELVGSQVIVGPSHFAEPFGHLVADADGRAGWRPL